VLKMAKLLPSIIVILSAVCLGVTQNCFSRSEHSVEELEPTSSGEACELLQISVQGHDLKAPSTVTPKKHKGALASGKTQHVKDASSTRQGLFKSFDSNHDGRLSTSEFEAGLTTSKNWPDLETIVKTAAKSDVAGKIIGATVEKATGSSSEAWPDLGGIVKQATGGAMEAVVKKATDALISSIKKAMTPMEKATTRLVTKALALENKTRSLSNATAEKKMDSLEEASNSTLGEVNKSMISVLTSISAVTSAVDTAKTLLSTAGVKGLDSWYSTVNATLQKVLTEVGIIVSNITNVTGMISDLKNLTKDDATSKLTTVNMTLTDDLSRVSGIPSNFTFAFTSLQTGLASSLAGTKLTPSMVTGVNESLGTVGKSSGRMVSTLASGVVKAFTSISSLTDLPEAAPSEGGAVHTTRTGLALISAFFTCVATEF